MENQVSAYQIEIRSSGKRFTAQAGETVLAAAARQGITLPYSCRNGTCASCHGRVLEGRVNYPYQPPQALSAEELARGEALFCQAVPDSDLLIEAREIEAVRDFPVRTLPARVEERVFLSPQVARLMLRLPRGQRLQFMAGQYADVLLSGGRRRAFSIASPPQHADRIELHVRYVAGGDFTEWVFGDMPERAILRLEAPLGTFFVRGDSDRPMLMMGGGTGFAPLKAMVEQLLADGDYRPLHLFWGARNRRELYQSELPQAWAREHQHIRYTPVLSEPEPGDDWDGARGLVHHELLRRYPDLSPFDVYMSGPPAMIDAARHAFLDTGLAEERLYYDSFDFAPRTSSESAGDEGAAGPAPESSSESAPESSDEA